MTPVSIGGQNLSIRSFLFIQVPTIEPEEAFGGERPPTRRSAGRGDSPGCNHVAVGRALSAARHEFDSPRISRTIQAGRPAQPVRVPGIPPRCRFTGFLLAAKNTTRRTYVDTDKRAAQGAENRLPGVQITSRESQLTSLGRVFSATRRDISARGMRRRVPSFTLSTFPSYAHRRQVHRLIPLIVSASATPTSKFSFCTTLPLFRLVNRGDPQIS